MEKKEIKISERTQKMLNNLSEIRELFNEEYKNTPHYEDAETIEIDFTAHLADLCDDITALMGYNTRMNLNL